MVGRLLSTVVALLTPWLAAPAAPAAAVQTSSFQSQALSGQEHYAVYFPPGYALSGRRYPVLYALQGLPSGPAGYSRMPIATFGRIAAAAGHPVIVVAPQGARQGDTDPEWHDWGAGRDWETAVAVDLVQHVDATYRTIPDRRHRAIVGLSAGGYGAALIGLHHLDTFSVIQSWSGYFHPTNPAGTAPLDVGSPAADAAASAHTLVGGLKRAFARWGPTYLGFYIGAQDWRFLPENLRFHRELVAAGVPHYFSVYTGAHTFALWTPHEPAWIGRASRELAGSRPGA
jgi:enterochelin esterase-like enzyme